MSLSQSAFTVVSATPPFTVMDAINCPQASETQRTTQPCARLATVERLHDRTDSAFGIFCAGDMTLLRHANID